MFTTSQNAQNSVHSFNCRYLYRNLGSSPQCLANCLSREGEGVKYSHNIVPFRYGHMDMDDMDIWMIGTAVAWI